ncbi:integrase core domain-containing protein [Bifidobacterium longum subsp. longum]|nr:integrase core domain-containing protein [Bifidobacterium longum subsp. longum]
MFVSHHTLKWTRTCRSHGRHPHAHTAHFLLNRHIRAWYFNPRTPVGCDLDPSVRCFRCCYFNPRTPVGCDLHRPRRARARLDFNPRTPVGCDSTSAAIHPHTTDFNPRTPVGCDELDSGLNVIPGISIHAPQWGATTVSSLILQPDVFQSTHPSGVRPTVVNPRWFSCQFQSTHPSGVRL